MGDIIKSDAEIQPFDINIDDILPLIDEYIELRDYARRSAALVKNTIVRFIKWYNQYHPKSPMEYRNFLLDNGLKRSYVSNQFSILRMFWEFLAAKGIVSNNPFKVVVIRTGRLPARTGLSEDEVKRLVKLIDKADARTQAIVNLLLRTGLRVHSVSEIDIDDIDYSSDPPKLYVKHKGHRSKENFVYLYSKTLKSIERYLKVARPNGRSKALFLKSKYPYDRLGYHGIYRIVTQVLNDAGIKGKTPHDLRHTAITLARKHGAPLDAVREMAGHARIDTTLHYDHSIQREIVSPEKILNEVI